MRRGKRGQEAPRESAPASLCSRDPREAASEFLMLACVAFNSGLHLQMFEFHTLVQITGGSRETGCVQRHLQYSVRFTAFYPNIHEASVAHVRPPRHLHHHLTTRRNLGSECNTTSRKFSEILLVWSYCERRLKSSVGRVSRRCFALWDI